MQHLHDHWSHDHWIKKHLKPKIPDNYQYKLHTDTESVYDSTNTEIMFVYWWFSLFPLSLCSEIV